MDIKNKQFKILGGPSLDTVVDIFKYTAKDVNIIAKFQIEQATCGTAYDKKGNIIGKPNVGLAIIMSTQSWRITKIAYEDGSMNGVNAEGTVSVKESDYNGSTWTVHRYRMYYNHKTRTGTIHFLD